MARSPYQYPSSQYSGSDARRRSVATTTKGTTSTRRARISMRLRASRVMSSNGWRVASVGVKAVAIRPATITTVIPLMRRTSLRRLGGAPFTDPDGRRRGGSAGAFFGTGQEVGEREPAAELGAFLEVRAAAHVVAGLQRPSPRVEAAGEKGPGLQVPVQLGGGPV